MLKINNQDDCCLYNNVFNYQYGFLSSQFVPALLWMETPLLSNGHHVSTLQFHFRAINSINLADPSDKAAKKKQAERNKGGHVRPQNRENKPGQGEQAGVVQSCTSTSSLSLHVGRPLRHRATSWASDGGAASLSLLSLPSVGHPKSRLSPQSPQELVKELDDSLALITCCAGASLQPPVPAEYPAGFTFTSLLNT